MSNALERERKHGFRKGVVRVERLNEGHGLRGGDVLPAEAEDAGNGPVDNVVQGAAGGKDLLRLGVVCDRDAILDEGTGGGSRTILDGKVLSRSARRRG